MDCNTAFFMSVHLGAITGENAFIAVGLVEDTHPLVRAPGWANNAGDSIGYHSARQTFAEHFSTTTSSHCTATAGMLNVAQCSANP